ncbi:MAG: hypothetical protein QXV69_04290 [Sulfolobaceae archaeon]
MNVEFPEILLFKKVTIPVGTEVWFNTDNENVILESDALKQPKIIIYPEYKVDGNEWIVFRDNRVISIDENLNERVIKSINEEGYPISYNSNIEFIYKRKNRYYFNNFIFSKFDKKYNFFILINKKFSLIGNKEKVIEIETPKSYYIGKNHISVLYENNLKIFNKDLINIKSYKSDLLFIGSTRFGEIFASESGRILLKSEFIGICKDPVLLGEIRNGFVLKCEHRLKVYKDNTLISFDINAKEYGSIANDRYIILSTNYSTIIYNQNLEKILELKSVKASFLLNSLLILLSQNNNIYFLNLNRKNSKFINIINRKNSKDRPIVIEIEEKIPYNISISNNFIIINKIKNNDKTILEIEPIEFKDNTLEVTLENDLFKYSTKFEVETEKPRINLIEALLRTAKNGRIKGTEYNSELEVKINVDIPSRLPHELKIELEGNKSEILPLETNNKIVRIYLNNYEYNINNKIVRIYLNRLNKNIFEIEIPVKVLFIEKPSECKVEESIEDRKLIVRRICFKELFEWEEKEERLMDYDDILIVKDGECIKLNNEKICSKEEITKFIIRNDKGYKTFYIIRYPNPIKDVNCRLVNNNQLEINVNLKRDALVEIIYGNNVAIGNSTVFKFDPFYNKIILKSYIGNLKWINEYALDSFKIGLIIAKTNYERLKDILQTFGVL